MAEEKHDAQEVKEILQVVSTEIPKLLESITNMMNKPENAENLGKSLAIFYKQLKDAGMDDKQAFELTQKYMASFSIGGMIGQVMGGAKAMGDDDLGKKIKEKMKREIDES